MDTGNLLKKTLVFICGLFIMALGVALSVKASLGVSPISCIPYIFSLNYHLTMGEATILFNIVLILLQVILLNRNYRLIQLLQLPVVFVFGFFTDITLHLVSGIIVTNYVWQSVLCLLSCVVIAFGVFLEVKAGITYLPGEGLAMAIANTFKKEFGKIKIGVDSSMVVACLLSSFILLHQLKGVREGTIVAALLVGFLARFYNKNLSTINTWVEYAQPKKIITEAISATLNKKLIITISREFGSGGHEIGKYIAQHLGVSFYDKELIKLTAEQSNFTTAYIERHEQSLANTLLYELYEQNYAYVNEQLPPLDALFLVQSKIIRQISEKESCVIVGRCADFILKDNPYCFNVFIHANKEYRKTKAVEEYGITLKKIDKELERTDHERVNYYRYYTGKNRNDATNYHLTVDSSFYGSSERTAQLIIEAVKKTNSLKNQN